MRFKSPALAGRPVGVIRGDEFELGLLPGGEVGAGPLAAALPVGLLASPADRLPRGGCPREPGGLLPERRAAQVFVVGAHRTALSGPLTSLPFC